MSQSGRSLRRGIPQEATSHISFVEAKNGFWGTGLHERAWHISKAVTGWRLEFRDPGDDAATYAGIHGTLDLAKREAEVTTGAGRRA